MKSGVTTDADGEASLTIKNLTLNISAPVNDAINAEQLLNIESGTLNISAADDAVHCDLVLNIGADGTDGPTIDIAECYEGLEAAELNVLSGNISILSSDDCLNAAKSDLSNYDLSMNISGGTINAYSSEGNGFGRGDRPSDDPPQKSTSKA
ncbi:MAG: carbohydrate-binding domain-containing protein [Oscillospiraceae bacterium]|nr:carbohydrate-binding domain-containing protein [Oscillospiraceae bacterium]